MEVHDVVQEAVIKTIPKKKKCKKAKKDFFFSPQEFFFLHFCSNYSGLMASDSCQYVTLVSDGGAAISYPKWWYQSLL